MTKEVLQSILGSKIIAFHAIYAKAIGSVPAAVMLSQGLFWQEDADFKSLLEIDGQMYFGKTAEEWYEATGVTEEQQKTAREYLRRCGVLLEKRAGLPAKMHYRIDLDSLVAVISRYLSGGEKVAVDSRSKKREITRSSSGKFRQLEAGTYGDNYIESLESLNDSKEDSAENPQGYGLKTEGVEPKNEPYTVETPKKRKKDAPGGRARRRAGPFRLYYKPPERLNRQPFPVQPQKQPAADFKYFERRL